MTAGVQPLCPQGWGAGAQPGTFHALCDQEMGCSLQALWCLCSQCSQCSPCSQQPALLSFVVASRRDVKPWHKPWHQLCLPTGAGHPTGQLQRASPGSGHRSTGPGSTGTSSLLWGRSNTSCLASDPRGAPVAQLWAWSVSWDQSIPLAVTTASRLASRPRAVLVAVPPLTRALMHRAPHRGGEP